MNELTKKGYREMYSERLVFCFKYHDLEKQHTTKEFRSFFNVGLTKKFKLLKREFSYLLHYQAGVLVKQLRSGYTFRKNARDEEQT